MCLFQVLLPLGTTIAMEMHFSRHAPRGGLSLLLKSTRSFHQISCFFSFPIRLSAPCVPLCSHAVLQLWPYGVHLGQRIPKYPVPWSKNAQMPENPWGLTPHLGVCWLSHAWGGQSCFNIPLWHTISKTNSNNQLAPKRVQDPCPSLWLRDDGAAVPEGAGCGKSSCQHFSLDCCSVWYFRAGLEGGCIHFDLGKVVQKKGREILTTDGVALKSAQKVRLLSKGDQG